MKGSKYFHVAADAYRPRELRRTVSLVGFFLFVVLATFGFTVAQTNSAHAAQRGPQPPSGQTPPRREPIPPVINPTETPAPGCTQRPRSGDLRARITDSPATTSARFTNRSDTCSYQIGLAVYKRFDNNIDNQELYDYQLAVIGPNSTLDLSVSNPPCAYQGDAFWGELIVSFQGGVRYGERRLDDTDGVNTQFCVRQTPTGTPAAGTETPVPPSSTPVPPTATSVPPSNTPVPPPATNTVVPPTATSVPPSNTPVPPSNTPVPPTNTAVPPTATSVPPSNTPVPPSNTPVLPTNTAVPPTATGVPATATSTTVPPTATNTAVPPTATGVPATATAVPPTATNTLAPPTTVPAPPGGNPPAPPAPVGNPAPPVDEITPQVSTAPPSLPAPVNQAKPLVGGNPETAPQGPVSQAKPLVSTSDEQVSAPLPLTGMKDTLSLALALATLAGLVIALGLLLRLRMRRGQ
jgi:hypothetical protein